MKTVIIKIADKEIEFAFGLGFLGEALEGMDMSIEEVHKKLTQNPFKTVPSFMYYSAKYAKERKLEDYNHTLIDMIDLVDLGGGMKNDGVTKFLNMFTDSLLKGVPKEDPNLVGPEGDSKKK